MKTLLIALAMVATMSFTTKSAEAQTNPTQNIPVVGTLPGGALFNGTFSITNFITQNGQLFAVGTLTNTATGIVYSAVQLPVIGATGTCQILQLDLGPIHLDLLGLTVDLNAIHLNITAQSGSGNLLGNLLCAVAHLLDRNGPLTGITGLLNNILRAL